MNGLSRFAAALRQGAATACFLGGRRQAAEAFRLEAKLNAALAASPLLATVRLTTRARLARGRRGRPMVELNGQVPSAEAYREVLRILSDHAWRVRPGVGVIDRIVLAPPRSR